MAPRSRHELTDATTRHLDSLRDLQPHSLASKLNTPKALPALPPRSIRPHAVHRLTNHPSASCLFNINPPLSVEITPEPTEIHAADQAKHAKATASLALSSPA
jgi:hypothetical protein